jgi:hypothetical protein
MDHAMSKEAVMLSAEADQIIEELLHTTAGRTDPYPLYHRLRTLAPAKSAPCRESHAEGERVDPRPPQDTRSRARWRGFGS